MSETPAGEHSADCDADVRAAAAPCGCPPNECHEAGSPGCYFGSAYQPPRDALTDVVASLRQHFPAVIASDGSGS